jgi:hypothetical protein
MFEMCFSCGLSDFYRPVFLFFRSVDNSIHLQTIYFCRFKNSYQLCFFLNLVSSAFTANPRYPSFLISVGYSLTPLFHIRLRFPLSVDFLITRHSYV